MTNIDRFRHATAHLSSPDLFIDWSFYYMIGASLQRRVWLGDLDHLPLFMNLYVIFVGDPGVGKTLIIKPVNKLLTYWKKDKSKQKEDLFDSNEFSKVAKATSEEPSIIKVGANATTFEALCRNMSRSVQFYFPPSKPGEPRIPYVHSSLCFTLEELSSLLRKHSESVVDYLLQAYDCGSYRYETIGRGEDFVKNPCLSILGGTTPDFMKRIFGTQDALLSGGLASRIIFVYANEARFRTSRPPIMTEDQRTSEKYLLEHIRKLTEVFGPLDFGHEALDYMENWWKEVEPKTRINNNPKLKDYYARKNITVFKLASILWFSDNTSLKVVNGVEYIKQAINITEGTEREMHKVLTFDNKNPIAPLARDIGKYVAKFEHGVSKRDIVLEFFGEAPEGSKSIEQAIEHLIFAGKIKYEGNIKRYMVC